MDATAELEHTANPSPAPPSPSVPVSSPVDQALTQPERKPSTSAPSKRRKPRNAAQRAADAEFHRNKRAAERAARELAVEKFKRQIRDAEQLKAAPAQPVAAPAAPVPVPADASAGSPSPGIPVPSRPGWPSDSAIAESTQLAELIVLTVGAISAASGSPILEQKIKAPVRRADGTRELVEVNAGEILVERTAAVLAKYNAAMTDSPEMALAAVAVPLLLKPLLPKLLAFAAKRVPALAGMAEAMGMQPVRAELRAVQ